MAENFRAKMHASQRAKQFTPFAALKGFEDALRKKEIIYTDKPQFSEEMLENLNAAFSKLKKDEKITVTYYDNGSILKISDIIKRIDDYNRVIFLGNCPIHFDDILEIIL